MKKLLLLVALVTLFSCNQNRELTIIHLNDTHSHIEPIRGGKYDGLGGVIERAAFIDSVRNADGAKNVLLLHAGDYSQGTSYFTKLHGDIEDSVLNILGYDAVCLGNHEFDNGVEELARRVKNTKCPVLCANYDFKGTPLEGIVLPYTIVKKAGKKIGIIGVLTDLSIVVSKEQLGAMKKLDDAKVVNELADYLKNKEHCDMVIALTHIGYEGEEYTDPKLVKDTRNIDLVVGGHSHTFLDEIKYAKNLDGKDIPIVQDGCWGLNVGILKVK